MKKQLFEVFVCMLLIGTCFVVAIDTVFAEDLVEGDYTYTISNGEATIKDYTGSGGDITIPSTLGGYPTVRIGDSAFIGTGGGGAEYSIKSIIIPYGVTTIGNGSFSSLQGLTSITIPDSVTSIGYMAFRWCPKLSSITIPNKVPSIGDLTFKECFALASVTIGNGVKTIGVEAFALCSITTLTIPDSVTTISSRAFSGCTHLTTATIGNGVTIVGTGQYGGGYVFNSCTSLTSVTIGTNVTEIRRETFYDCSSLTSITFLGLVAPTMVGEQWITKTPAELRGHAYAWSNFPAPGEVWHGLMMGDYIGEENEAPTAAFTWSPVTPIGNQTVTFDASTSTDTDGSITTYEWDWNNDGTYDDSKTTPTVTHSWTQAGSYPVTLQVTDNDGETKTKTTTVTVSSTGGNGGTDNKGTPGFELVFVIGAIAIAMLILRKKRIV